MDNKSECCSSRLCRHDLKATLSYSAAVCRASASAGVEMICRVDSSPEASRCQVSKQLTRGTVTREVRAWKKSPSICHIVIAGTPSPGSVVYCQMKGLLAQQAEALCGVVGGGVCLPEGLVKPSVRSRSCGEVCCRERA